jgi:hypothetical protein
MRLLFQPRILAQASLASVISVLGCYPRLALWANPTAPIWFLAAAIFICAITLWGFVFAWHEACAKRPVFIFKPDPRLWALATGLASLTALTVHFWVDPALRSRMPEDYPEDLKHWLAAALFSLALTQLFLVFAPFAWLVRLFKNRRAAAILTVAFGAAVMAMKAHSLTPPLPLGLLLPLLVGKLITGSVVIWLYLRGGIFLICWWTLLFESRHLLDLFAAR